MAEVWIFLGEGGTHAAAVFSTRERAEAWIAQHKLSGILTLYPIDEPIHDWAIAQGFFRPKWPSQHGARFIQRFSSAYREHHHYEDGVLLA